MKTKTLSELAAMAGVKGGEKLIMSFDNVYWMAIRGNDTMTFTTLKCRGNISTTTINLRDMRIEIKESPAGKSSVVVFTEDNKMRLGYQYMSTAKRLFIESCIRYKLEHK